MLLTGSDIHPGNFTGCRDVYVYFKGGDSQLGDVLYFRGDTYAEKIANIFREEGISFIRKLRHNFILYLWDSRTRDAYLVRDRFGIEPLYFKADSGRLAFSQNLAELRGNESIDASKVYSYLLGVNSEEDIPDSRTFFEGLHVVPPGCYIHASPGGTVDCRAYWGAEPLDITSQKQDSLFGEFRTRLIDSVVSSTQGLSGVGAHLSGGLDSSLITLVYSGIRKAPFPTFYFNLGNADQRDLYYAGIVAERTGCPHYRILPENDIYSCLYRLSRACSAPENFILPSSVHYAVGKAARGLGCGAILTGSDGDSIVGHGYGYLKELRQDDFEMFLHYLVQFRLADNNTGQLTAPEIRREIIGKEMLHALRFRDWRRIAGILRLAQTRFGFIPLQFLQYLARGLYRRLNAGGVLKKMKPFLNKSYGFSASENSYWVADDLYERGDKEIVENFRAAVNATFSAHFEQFYAMEKDLGIRYLHPFFDKDLFELCLAIPDAMRFGKGKTRWLMRNAMKDLLPEELYHRQDKDEFSHYLVSSCRSLWTDNRERFEENKSLWLYIDKSQFRKQVDILLAGKHPVAVSRSLARKLNRIMYLGVWLDTLGA